MSGLCLGLTSRLLGRVLGRQQNDFQLQWTVFSGSSGPTRDGVHHAVSQQLRKNPRTDQQKMALKPKVRICPSDNLDIRAAVASGGPLLSG
jgi:hypothetical protein